MADLVAILVLIMLVTGSALVVLALRARAIPRTRTDADGERRLPGEGPPTRASHTAPAATSSRSPVEPAEPAGDALLTIRLPGAAEPPRESPRTPEDETLAVLEFDTAPWKVAVTRPEIVIGRHTQDDIRLTDVRVSRHHAKLFAHDDGRFEILNLTATRPEPNPMLVNGRSIERSAIADGDVVTLGGVSFTFRAAA